MGTTPPKRQIKHSDSLSGTLRYITQTYIPQHIKWSLITVGYVSTACHLNTAAVIHKLESVQRDYGQTLSVTSVLVNLHLHPLNQSPRCDL